MSIHVLRLLFGKLFVIILLAHNLNLDAQNIVLEPMTSIDEVWRKDMNIPVSGEIRTGLVSDISGNQYVQEYFYVNLPKQKSDVLFVEITSNDGRYSATMSFNIKEQPPGILKLKWNTQFYNDLKEFSYKELTILSWVVNNENNSTREFLVSSWTVMSTLKFIYVVLNSEQQSFINLYNSDTNNSINIKCEQFSDQAHVSYSSFCKIPLDSININTEISIVQRARRSYNRYPLKLNF